MGADASGGRREVFPFFIVGSQRSGTTLLRLILNAHSVIAIPEEGTFWMPILRMHARHPERLIPQKKVERYCAYIRKNTQFRLWGLDPDPVIRDLTVREEGATLHDLMAAFYDAYARQEGKRQWGEKSSSFFRKIRAVSRVFPDARYIHIIRDGRDVYLSWKKLVPSRKNIAVAALEWKFKVKKIERSFRGLPDASCMTVRYEDLVSRPEETAREICAFLQVDFEPGMIDFWKESKRYIGAHHSDLIFQPISTGSVGKWEKGLSAFQKSAYEKLAGDVLGQYGYPCDYAKSSLGVGGAFRLGSSILFGLPARAFQVFWTALRLWLAAKMGVKTTAAGKGDAPAAGKGPPSPQSSPRRGEEG